MDETMGTLSNGSAEERNAVFERVWKRVMEGRTDASGSPIVWGEDRAAQMTEAHGSLQGEEETVQDTALLPMGSQRAQRDRTRSDFPQGDRARSDFPQGQVGFLGDNCLDCVPMLQEMIRRELADRREYQTLARRVGGHQAKTFQALANEEKRHAKRLSAAYFLISGVRYWPEGEKAVPPTSYLGTLRRRFGEEQAGMAAYLAGAEATSDPCLRQLFLDHAQEEWDHACKIRSLVEQA